MPPGVTIGATLSAFPKTESLFVTAQSRRRSDADVHRADTESRKNFRVIVKQIESNDKYRQKHDGP